MLWGIPADYVLYGVSLGLSLLIILLSLITGAASDFSIDADLDAGVDSGIDHGHHTGHAHGVQGLPRYTLFNPIALLAFLGGFGATGFIARGLGISVWTALFLAGAGGLLFSIVFFQLFTRVALGSEGSAAPELEAAIGKLAMVTVPIPVGGLGAVSYVIAGQRQTIAARHSGQERLPIGVEVVIVDLQQYVAVVKPFQ
jgi:hypothetical protein